MGILPVIRGGGRRLFREGLPPLELRLDRCTVADGIPILGVQPPGEVKCAGALPLGGGL